MAYPLDYMNRICAGSPFPSTASDEPTRRDEERKRNLLRRKDWRQRLEYSQQDKPPCADIGRGLWKTDAAIAAVIALGCLASYLLQGGL